jgi:predicted O-methyltransferase YrrM
MSDIRARNIKDYIDDLFGQEDEVLLEIKNRCLKAKLPKIQVPASIGKLLYLFVKMINPQKILEIGTLGGYSTVWMARALGTEGFITTLELDPLRAELARENFILANVNHKIDVIAGPAKNSLEALVEKKGLSFDLIFIDADKEHYPIYLDLALKLSKKGTVILSDNVIPRGVEMLGQKQIDAVNIYEFNKKIATHPLLESTIVNTVVNELEFGRIDGLAICRVK